MKKDGGDEDLAKLSSTVTLRAWDEEGRDDNSFLQKVFQKKKFSSSKTCNSFLQSELALYAPRRELWLNHAFESVKNVLQDSVCVTSGNKECKQLQWWVWGEDDTERKGYLTLSKSRIRFEEDLKANPQKDFPIFVEVRGEPKTGSLKLDGDKLRAR